MTTRPRIINRVVDGGSRSFVHHEDHARLEHPLASFVGGSVLTNVVRVLPLVLFIVLSACGSAAPPATTRPPVTLTRHRADLGCVEELPSGEAACVAAGATWQAPLFCSGIEQPFEVSREGPCVCVTQDEMMRCMSVP